MSKFSDKDFFGDPIWPADFESEKKKSQNSEPTQQAIAKKSIFNPEQSQNSCESNSLQAEDVDAEEIQRSYIVNEMKMLYSNFKHSQITYLDDPSKAFQFSKDDIESPQKLGESEDSQDSEKIRIKKQAEIQIERLFFSLPDLSESSIQSELSSQNQHINIPMNKIRQNKKLQRKVHRVQINNQIIQKKQKIEYYHKIKLFQQDQKESLPENPRSKKQMEEFQTNIMKKLQILEQQEQIKNKCKIQVLKPKKIIKKDKTQKYKILTQSEKQYLVYLSTLTTTCEVARRFNISVNNICRWKKGCKRKVGAGRKIVNQDLEQKVILYVKNLMQEDILFTRKQIQEKAKQLSQNKHFKASKGWFERFYHRNIEIFYKSGEFEII